jgi:hypothetical protein
MQNGIHLVQPLQGQTGGIQRVPDLGCEQYGEEQSVPLLQLPHVYTGHCNVGEGCLSCFWLG